MSGAVLTLDLIGKQLVVASSGAVPLSGSDRLFLTSILGLKAQDGEGGSARFVRRVDGATGRLVDSLVSYLAEEELQYELGPGAKSMLAARQSSNQELAAAREAGARIRQMDLLETPAIPGFFRELKPYQIPAVAHLVAVRHAANFSVPGSGKTTMVLAAYAQVRETENIELLLIIGPRSCFAPWEEEFQACFGRAPKCIRLAGSPSERAAKYEAAAGSNPDLVLVTYQTAANDGDKLGDLLTKRRTMLVLDESHYVKRLSGGVWARAVVDLAPYAVRRVILSGTPVPNGIEDIWSQMTFLWPEPPLLGASDIFHDRVVRGGEDMPEEVREELLPFFWRVKKSDVQLPAPEFHRVEVPLRPYQTTIYNALAARILADVAARPEEREKLRQWRRAKMVRLLQAASNPSLLTEYSPEFKIPPLSAEGLSVSEIIERYSQYETPAKVDFTVQLVESILQADPTAKVVVWSAFVHNLETLERALSAWAPRVIHGEVPKDASEDSDFNREDLIRQFKTDARYRVLLANPGACAESISLHRACKHAIYMDRSFNGAQFMQSLDRIHRLGLLPEDKVHYYFLIGKGTIDEVVHERLDEKHRRLLRLLEGELTSVDLDSSDVTDEGDEATDFEAMVEQLRGQFAAK